MTSTSVFYGAGSTLTIHMPARSAEAVLLVEGLDNAASITLSIDEVRRLIATLEERAAQFRAGEPRAEENDLSL